MLKIGDKVKIRGDLRKNYGGKCIYTVDQLVDGIYVKRAFSDLPWVGVVKAINGDMALVGGGWRGIETLVLA